MKRNNVSLRHLTAFDMERLWEISSQEKMPEWAKFNAPYFREYEQRTIEQFLTKDAKYYLDSPQNFGIFYNDALVGCLSYYWEHEGTRWMEYGLVIYDESVWGKGIGYDASILLIDYVFGKFPEIQRMGCTSWSGNPGMMHLANKLGMQLEGRMRKTRFWDGTYYDSLRYGVLRSEWEEQNDKRK